MYECPHCGSKKKPRYMNSFPPLIVECPDCNERDYEKKYINFRFKSTD